MELLFTLQQILKQDMSCVYVSIIEQNGSTPRKDHARMLVLENKEVLGTIGGGKLEGQAIEKAKFALENSVLPEKFYAELSSEDAALSDMICGGSLSLYIHKIEANKENIEVFTQLYKELEQGNNLYLYCPLVPHRAFALGTEKHPEEKLYFSDPYCPPKRLVLVGAGHVAKATAQLANFLGYRVLILDDREEFLKAERFPKSTQCRICSLENAFENIEIYPNDALVIVTRGHLFDSQVLKSALKTPAFYIGMIGSRRKKAMIYQMLQEEGISLSQLEKVHAPIGLPLNADTPEEIALSIMAEIMGMKESTKLKEIKI